MDIKEILSQTAHRPWKLPIESWKFYQEWNRVIFLHWQVELDELQKFVPKEIEIDLFEGKPWVSLVAFTMQKIRPRNLPHFKPISDFNEINIRTYVKSPSKSGVLFLSIEAGNHISCKIARMISKLPYRYAQVERENHSFRASNTDFNDQLSFSYRIGQQIKNKTKLDIWLTERYALIQDTEHTINTFDIHHSAWPLKEIQIQNPSLDYPRFNKLIHRNPDTAQYSDGVEVLSWGKQSKAKASYHNEQQ